MQWFSYLDKREVLQQEYSQAPILTSPHFRWVVNLSNAKSTGGVGPSGVVVLTLLVVVKVGKSPLRPSTSDVNRNYCDPESTLKCNIP